MLLDRIIDGRCSHCFGKVEPDTRICPHCQTVLIFEPEVAPTPPDAATLGYSQKEEKSARRIYDSSKYGRSKGYILWLFVAAAWALLGYLIQQSGEISGTSDPQTSTFFLFYFPAILMIPMFFWGNSHSKKKQKEREAKVNALDPRLVERFRWEDEDTALQARNFRFQMKEADRLAKQARAEERDRQREKDEDQEHLLYD